MINFDYADAILAILKNHVGEEHAIKDPAIRQFVNVPDRDPRKPTAGLREIINTLRQSGEPICSSTNGYWYAKNAEELKNCIEALDGRAIKIFEATKGMKKALNNLFNDKVQAKFL
jgi:hypothetical protein